MSCNRTLVRLPVSDLPFRYRCSQCDRKMKIANGVITDRAELKVTLRLTQGEVMHLINLLELRSRTPEEEHILQACYASKLS